MLEKPLFINSWLHRVLPPRLRKLIDAWFWRFWRLKSKLIVKVLYTKWKLINLWCFVLQGPTLKKKNCSIKVNSSPIWFWILWNLSFLMCRISMCCPPCLTFRTEFQVYLTNTYSRSPKDSVSKESACKEGDPNRFSELHFDWCSENLSILCVSLKWTI